MNLFTNILNNLYLSFNKFYTQKMLYLNNNFDSKSFDYCIKYKLDTM